ncbi:MAG: hypothetical protein E7018_02395 [Alphaproteobacteria bacterium]|nr:hypothetical protein [Alphaproteobacteria bacterium]
MPQLDFSVFPSQFFWLAISFFVLLFVMAKFIVPRTAEMINLRKDKIDADLNDAAKLKQKVEKTLEKYNAALKKASEDANASLAKTKEELDLAVERKQAELSAELSRQISEGEKKIATTKNKAMADIDANVGILVPLVWQKLGFGALSAKEVNSAIKTLGEK